MQSFRACCFFLFFALSLCSQFEKVVLESEPEILFNGWSSVRKAAPEEVVTLRFNLLQQNLDVLLETFESISDPNHQNYRKFLTREQLKELISPPEGAVQKVENWLREKRPSKNMFKNSNSGLISLKRNQIGDYLFAEMTVALAEELFDVDLHVFAHPVLNERKKNTRLIRSRQKYTVPMHLSSIVRSVNGLTNFPPIRDRKRSMKEVGDPGQSITPAVLRTRYNINMNGTQDKANGQALAEFEQEYFYQSDLNIFQQKYGLPVQNVSYIVGTNDPNSGVLGEASLDVQYIMAVSTNTITWVWELDAFDLVQWGINVTETPHAPPVHSISYGSQESSFESSTLTQVNIEFQKLGTLGFSLFVASGDEGTGHSGLFTCGKFDPDFPGCSPYVTSVGGTYLDNNNNEVGAQLSGGGFSNVFPQPKYQTPFVNSYLQSQQDLPDKKYYNAAGRAVPDVSSFATNYQVVIEGDLGPISGTSAACPVFAGLIALVNGELIKNNKPPLGFLNPALYQLGKVGTDITQGNNRSPPCSKGFSAATGWDPITGLGTPLFSFLSQQLLNLTIPHLQA